MKGYLADVNHVDAHFNKSQSFMLNLRTTPASDLIRLSAVSYGEICAGHQMCPTTNIQIRSEYNKFVIEFYQHLILQIDSMTGPYYAQIMGRIWQANEPKGGQVGTDAHLLHLGVDINDVWLVASAWEHGLTVLTQDRMKCIREAAPEVDFECWI